MKKGNKISILGAGNVGATIAYTLTLDGLASEIVLVDINGDKAKGEAMDIVQCTALCPSVDIYAGDYSDIKDSDIVVVTLGCGRKPGQSRIDLAQGNVNIIKSVMPQAVKYAPDAIYLAVSNPVDIITYAMLKVSGLPENRVFGSGTLLDSSRLRERIARDAHVSPQNVHAYVFGEHGDSSIIPWSLTSIDGIPMNIYFNSLRKKQPGFHGLDYEKIEDDVRQSGGEIIRLKGATFYAIGVSATRICRNILHGINSVMTLSGMLHGEYGMEDICMSLPFILSGEGIINSIAPPLLPSELDKIRAGGNMLKETISMLEI